MALGDGTGWDVTLPADSTIASYIDDYNRDLRVGIGDRLGKEHIAPAADSVGGEHKWITLQEQASSPTLGVPVTQVAVMYTKLIGTKHEFFFKNKDGQETQITSDGNLNITTFITGMIMMWSGLEADIPSGWHLCDGNASTPDLRNKFVVGAGSTYSPGDTGGEDTHTISIAEMPAHTHSFKSGLAGSDFVETGSANPHVRGTVPDVGGGGAHENRPPYYALCYIMKS